MVKPRDSVVGSVELVGDIVLATLNPDVIDKALKRGEFGYDLSWPVAYALPNGEDKSDLYLIDQPERDRFQQACAQLLAMVKQGSLQTPATDARYVLRPRSGSLRQNWLNQLLVNPVVIDEYTVIDGQLWLVSVLTKQRAEARKNASPRKKGMAYIL